MSSITFGSGRRRRAARAILLDPSDRILLINASDPAGAGGGDWWEIPGGGIDTGESAVDAIRRELWEEAGVAEAEIGPCIWHQAVEFSFAGWHFEQDEWIHVARCDGTSVGPRGLETFERMAFGEQLWWTLEEVIEQRPRTIPYRMAEFLPAIIQGDLPAEPLDITPDASHRATWHEVTG